MTGTKLCVGLSVDPTTIASVVNLRGIFANRSGRRNYGLWNFKFSSEKPYCDRFSVPAVRIRGRHIRHQNIKFADRRDIDKAWRQSSNRYMIDNAQ